MVLGPDDARKFSIALGIVVVITVLTQILLSFFGQPTGTETALFSVLQFLCSIGLSWVLAQLSSKKEFADRQKAFAVSAYRRVKEIDRGIDRILTRTRRYRNSVHKETAQELDVIQAVALGIRASIKSSVADWGDVIGEDIIKYEKIEELRAEQDRALEEDWAVPTSSAAPGPKPETDKKVEELTSSLPYSLQILSRDYRDNMQSRVNRGAEQLRDEYKRVGYVTLHGFWDKSFDRDVLELKVGDQLHVSLDDVGDRVGAFIARDAQGRSVGIITNKLSVGYLEFVNAMTRYLRRSKFRIELTKIEEASEPEQDDEDIRHSFEAKILDN